MSLLRENEVVYLKCTNGVKINLDEKLSELFVDLVRAYKTGNNSGVLNGNKGYSDLKVEYKSKKFVIEDTGFLSKKDFVNLLIDNIYYLTTKYTQRLMTFLFVTLELDDGDNIDMPFADFGTESEQEVDD